MVASFSQRIFDIVNGSLRWMVGWFWYRQSMQPLKTFAHTHARIHARTNARAGERSQSARQRLCAKDVHEMKRTELNWMWYFLHNSVYYYANYIMFMWSIKCYSKHAHAERDWEWLKNPLHYYCYYCIILYYALAVLVLLLLFMCYAHSVCVFYFFFVQSVGRFELRDIR